MLKTTVLLENLKEGLSFTNHAVSSRSPLPILLNFLIQARDGNLIISATDLEIGIQTKIPAKIEKEGSITVSAKTFLDFVSSIGEEKIELEEKEGILSLSSNHIKTRFPTTPTEEYPKLYESVGDKKAVIGRKNFKEAVSSVVFAAAQDSTRPALSGVLLVSGEKGVSMVATDGYRLSLKNNISTKTKSKGEGEKLLVPSRVFKEAVGVKGEQDISLNTLATSNQVLFEFDETIIIGRLIEAEYPDFEKIIPQDLATKAEIDKEEALSAVRSCSVIAREAANIIKMSVVKGSIAFSAEAASVGESEVEIEAKMEGEENEIAFNARYLLDFLTNINEEKITFEMTGPLNPGVFRVVGDANYLHLIMPIRITD